ncbi:MAG: hypothetical protein QG583_46 [Patescibacteria group bacterium]|nr:hypothetical protein [Patescibacteria group bacterium]
MFSLTILIPLHGQVVLGILIGIIILAIPDIKEHARNIFQIFKKD